MEESPSLTGHAARHSIYADYNYFYMSPAQIQRWEQGEPPCTLPRDKCYELAVKEKNWYLTKLHLDTAPQPTGREGVTALMQFGYKAEYAQYLLNLGADVNAQNTQGDSVLMHLMKYSIVEPEAVKMLMAAGANVHVRDKHGTHVIEYAARLCDDSVQVVEMLLAAGVSVLDLGTEVNSVLLSIFEYPEESIDFVKILTNIGADENAVEGDTSLHTALMNAIVRARTSRRIADMYLYKDMDTSLHTAVMNAYASETTSVHVVKMMIDGGLDVKVVNDVILHSALLCVVRNSEANMRGVKMLIDAGTDVNHNTKYNETALIFAKVDTIVQMLIDAGADVNAKDKYGNTVLMRQIDKNKQINLQLVKNLTEAGDNLLEENNKNETVLTIAISSYISFRLIQFSFWKENKEEMLLLIRHFLEHPQLNQNAEIIRSGANNPLKVLFMFCNNCDKVIVFDENFFELFKLIIHSQFKDSSYLENVELKVSLFESQIVSLGSIAVFLNKYYIQSTNISALQPCIQVMLDAGFDMQTGDVSPLTVFLLNVQYDDDVPNVEITDTQPEGKIPEPHPASKFIDFLINHGAHAGQQTLTLDNRDTDLQVLREQLYLPDAVLAALYTGE
jgi:ankyrin repeat protein